MFFLRSIYLVILPSFFFVLMKELGRRNGAQTGSPTSLSYKRCPQRVGRSEAGILFETTLNICSFSIICFLYLWTFLPFFPTCETWSRMWMPLAFIVFCSSSEWQPNSWGGLPQTFLICVLHVPGLGPGWGWIPTPSPHTSKLPTQKACKYM